MKNENILYIDYKTYINHKDELSKNDDFKNMKYLCFDNFENNIDGYKSFKDWFRKYILLFDDGEGPGLFDLNIFIKNKYYCEVVSDKVVISYIVDTLYEDNKFSLQRMSYSTKSKRFYRRKQKTHSKNYIKFNNTNNFVYNTYNTLTTDINDIGFHEINLNTNYINSVDSIIDYKFGIDKLLCGHRNWRNKIIQDIYKVNFNDSKIITGNSYDKIKSKSFILINPFYEKFNKKENESYFENIKSMIKFKVKNDRNFSIDYNYFFTNYILKSLTIEQFTELFNMIPNNIAYWNMLYYLDIPYSILNKSIKVYLSNKNNKIDDKNNLIIILMLKYYYETRSNIPEYLQYMDNLSLIYFMRNIMYNNDIEYYKETEIIKNNVNYFLYKFLDRVDDSIGRVKLKIDFYSTFSTYNDYLKDLINTFPDELYNDIKSLIKSDNFLYKNLMDAICNDNYKNERPFASKLDLADDLLNEMNNHKERFTKSGLTRSINSLVCNFDIDGEWIDDNINDDLLELIDFGMLIRNGKNSKIDKYFLCRNIELVVKSIVKPFISRSYDSTDRDEKLRLFNNFIKETEIYNKSKSITNDILDEINEYTKQFLK